MFSLTTSQDFEAAAQNSAQVRRFLVALTNELRMHNVTTIIAVESQSLFGPVIETPISNMSGVAENLILMRYVELQSQLFRLISILKVRESSYDPAIREFKISQDGIEVANTFNSAEAILSGIARPIPANKRRTSAQNQPRKRR